VAFLSEAHLSGGSLGGAAAGEGTTASMGCSSGSWLAEWQTHLQIVAYIHLGTTEELACSGYAKVNQALLHRTPLAICAYPLTIYRDFFLNLFINSLCIDY